MLKSEDMVDCVLRLKSAVMFTEKSLGKRDDDFMLFILKGFFVRFLLLFFFFYFVVPSLSRPHKLTDFKNSLWSY